MWIADAVIMAGGLIAYWRSDATLGIWLGLLCFGSSGLIMWLKRATQKEAGTFSERTRDDSA